MFNRKSCRSIAALFTLLRQNAQVYGRLCTTVPPIVFSILASTTCTCTAFRNKTLILTPRGDVIISLILNYVPRINNSSRVESRTGRDYDGADECFFLPSSPVSYIVAAAYTWILPREDWNEALPSQEGASRSHSHRHFHFIDLV